MTAQSLVNELAGERIPLMSRRPSPDPKHEWDISFGMVSWLEDLQDKVGYELLVIISAVEHVMHGFVGFMIYQACFFIYASYNVDAATIAIYSGIVVIPLALKPLIGIVSDLVPVGGYNKMPYMIMASIVGCASFFCVGFLPQQILPITFVVICFFFGVLQFSTNTFLVETKYAEKIRAIPECGPSIVSFVWFGMDVGGLVGVIVSGTVITAFSEKVPFMVAFFPAFLVMVPIWRNYLQEVPLSPEELKQRRAHFYRQKEVCFLCVVVLLATGALTATGLIYSDPKINCLVAGIVFVVTLVSFTIVLSPKIAAFNAFCFVQSSLRLSTAGAGFYFLTDNAEQYPEGPHFSIYFYTTVLGAVICLVSLIGVVSYQKFASTWRYRNLLVITNVVLSIFNMLDIVLFSRFNIKLGIPDTVFVLGTCVFETVLNNWSWMPQVILWSYLCPKDMEATMYALLTGCFNLGNIVAQNFSAFVLDSLDVHPNGSLGESDEFRNLWKVSLIAALLPIIPVLLLFKLVPDVAQGDRVLDVDDDATSGSLLNNWL